MHIAAACRYRGGKRGFANTTRAGEYGGVSFSDHMDAQDSGITCVAMIEDLAALDEIEGIVEVEGLDAIFIGRGDLAAAIGAPSMTSPELGRRSEEHTSELQSLMRISYAVFCLKKKKNKTMTQLIIKTHMK